MNKINKALFERRYSKLKSKKETKISLQIYMQFLAQNYEKTNPEIKEFFEKIQR